MDGQTMPLTFAALLQGRTGARLGVTAPAPARQRKDQSSLTGGERQRFVEALDALNQPDQTGISAYGRLVAIHADMRHHMHNMGDGSPESDLGQQRFLPWHRVYLHEFEVLLQGVDADITIPYWDWTSPAQQTIPQWLQTVRPTVNIPRPGPGRVTVIRFPGTMGYGLDAVVTGDVDPSIPALAAVQQDSDYTTFATGLESIHDLVHVWFGQRGTMFRLDRAPADPLFWMHHANVDRLWWQWQNSQPGRGKNPSVEGRDAIMDPWRYAESDTREIANFNYTYS